MLESLFSRPFSDWEMEEVNNFLLCLSHVKVHPKLRG